MKKFRLLTLLTLVAGAITAQENNFLVYSLKGNVSIVENKVESKVKVGKMLAGATTIKVPAGAAVTLICNETAMFTVQKAGNYSLSQFSDSCRSGGSGSVSVNYVKYVWSQMTKSGGSPGSDRKKFMNSVGAVSRSVNNIWIDPRLDTVNYSGGDFPLSWKSYADAKEFNFSLFTNSTGQGTPAYSTLVTKLKIPIGNFITKVKPGNTYFWTAAVKGEQNNELKVFNYVSKEAYDQMLKTLKDNAGTFENAAEESYRIAFMLEDAHYLSEAYQYYNKAATLAPDVPLYRSTLMSFKKDYEIK
jgi:hypothetical protein